MKMSSHGTIIAPSNVDFDEVTVRSTEQSYSLTAPGSAVLQHRPGDPGSLLPGCSPFTPQSEISCGPKQACRAKFSKNKHARREQKIKDMRKNGNINNVPKKVFKPHSSTKVDFVHQSLVEYIYPSSIIDLAKEKMISLNAEAHTSKLLEVLEVVGALAITLPALKTPAQVAAQLVLSMRALSTGSLCEQILAQENTIKWCKDLFGYNIFEAQSGIFGDIKMPTNVDWLSKIPSLRENWDAARNAPAFAKISALISVAASIGLCSVTNLKWSVQGIDLFRVGTISKHATAIDLVGAVLDTIVYFIEGGYECFKQRSFKPFFFSDDESKTLDELYFPLIELHEHAMVFNLHEKKVKIKGQMKIISDIEYSVLLDEALELAERLFKSAKGTWQQGYLEKRIDVLRKNRAAYQAKRIDGSMRFSPFTVYIWGDSGRGKTTIAQVVMADCLAASGVDPDAKNTAIIKESDKFDSALKGNTTGIFFDDLGNTKSDFLDKAPTERIIDINNNVITYANKADLHEKGKIEIRPRVFVITSNAPLAKHANIGSICPFSIVRRADFHLEVDVKPQYALPDGRLDSTKVFEEFPGDSLVNDIWDIQVYTPLEKSKGGDSSHLRHIDGTNECQPRPINHVLRLLTSSCVKHFENQRRLIRKGENLVASRNYCPDCHLSATLCECEQIAELDKFCEECRDLMGDASDDEDEQQASIQESFEHIKTQFDAMGARSANFLGRVPTWCFTNKVVTKLYFALNVREFLTFEQSVRKSLVFTLFWCLAACARLGQVNSLVYSGFAMLSHFIIYGSLLARWRDDRMNELLARRDATLDVFRSIRESKTKLFIGMCAIAGVIYKFTGIFRTAVALQQSALVPDDVAEIEARDAEVNPWAAAIASTLHVSDKSATMTFDQIVSKVEANLCHGVFVENNFQQKCDVLALGGNIFLMPMHVFQNRKDMKALLTRRNPSLLNSQFKAIVSANYIIPIEGKDLCLVYIASGGIFADIRHLFPDAITASGSGQFLYKEADGTVRSDSIRISYTRDSNSGGPGYDYELPYNTFTGLCMGVVIADFARSCIAGLHLRGVPNSPKGKALIVTRSEIQSAWDSASTKWAGAFPSTVNGDFPEFRYEKQVLVTQDIHAKSPINYLPLGSNVEYLGQDGHRVSHTKSKVRKTPISDAVTIVTGIPNEYGPPKFHRTRMWQASLAHSANPSAGIEGSLIELAYRDYVDGLISVFKVDKFRDWVYKELRPLTEMETLCGKDGKRFIDAMPKGTSKGYPLSGPKKEMITLLDPLDHPGFQCPAEADPMIVDEMKAMEQTLLTGERCYSIFKACVKDEPTKVTKDKVRVFQAADWATQMMVRKYFLPLARLLSLFPLDSECAVGVNAQGPEWDQLAQHMRKHGSDRIFAGDYSKYDLRMPAQLIIAAFAALIEIAQKCGAYSEDDLTIMRGIATEIAYSCVAYNGDMIIHKGSNPSGQNLTVYINCIVNSLQLRCAFFHLRPKTVPVSIPFREIVSVMTYGDDVKGSVKEGHDWYNHISYADFLKERDMVFTMPDKESEPTPYMSDLAADFLKRENKFNEDTGLIHGALAEESIFKSLHAVLESKVDSLKEQSAGNIDGALREWWQHGKEVYEMRRTQMQQVAEMCEMTSACKMLTQSYEDRLKHFEIRYLGLEPDEIDEIADEDTFVSTVGIEWDIE
jgi:hypothetical protein